MGCDQRRREIGADHAETGKCRAVQQGRGQAEQGDRAEKQKCDRWRLETIERIGRIDRRIGHGRTGRCENGRNIRSRQARLRQNLFAAPLPLAGSDQQERQQRAKRDTRAWADEALFDRVAHQKDAAERERNATDPHHPACSEALLKADVPCRLRHRPRYRAR